MLIVLSTAAGAQTSSQALPLRDRTADFDAFVQDFKRDYAYLDRPEKPWLTWKARYRDAVETAATRGAFDEVLAAALSELHDFHAEVRSPVPNRWLPVPTFADIWARFEGGRAVVAAVRRGSDADRGGIRAGDVVLSMNGIPPARAVDHRLTSAVNQADGKSRDWALLSVLTGRADESRRVDVVDRAGHVRSVSLPVERRFQRDDGVLTRRVMSGNVGYIRFNNSLGEQDTVSAFDRALAQLRSTRALVLDLRDTPSGGDSSVALGILGRFTTKLAAYQRHRIPHYGQADVERNWVEMVAPRGPFPYTAPVAVLVDHWTGSMGEGIGDRVRRDAAGDRGWNGDGRAGGRCGGRQVAANWHRCRLRHGTDLPCEWDATPAVGASGVGYEGTCERCGRPDS